MALSFMAAAAATRAVGLRVPSEAVECVCRSISDMAMWLRQAAGDDKALSRLKTKRRVVRLNKSCLPECGGQNVGSSANIGLPGTPEKSIENIISYRNESQVLSGAVRCPGLRIEFFNDSGLSHQPNRFVMCWESGDGKTEISSESEFRAM